MSGVSDELALAVEALATAEQVAREIVDKLAAAGDVSRVEIDAAIEPLLLSGRRLRSLVDEACDQLGIDRSSWTDKATLRVTVEALAGRLAAVLRTASRERLQRVADELRSGRVVHRQAARQTRLEAQRLQAASEVLLRLDGGPSDLPWPAQEIPTWIHWVLQLDEPLASEVHARIQVSYPKLEDLLTSLELESWVPGESPPSSVRGDDSAVDAVRAQGTSGSPDTDAANLLVSEEPSGTTSIEPARADSEVPLGNLSEAEPNREVLAHDRSVAGTSETSVVIEASEPPAPELTEGAVEVSRVVGESLDEKPSSSETTRTRRSTPVHIVVERPVTVPAELLGFERYRAAYWRGPDGRVTVAPWTLPEFATELEENAEQALGTRRWAHLIVHARAAQALQIDEVPRLRDVESLLAMLARPTAEASGVDPDRSGALMSVENWETPSFALRLRVFLEALRPSEAAPVDLEIAGDIVASAGFASKPLAAVLQAAFRVGVEGESPLNVMRSVRSQPVMTSPEALTREIDEARAHLRESVRRMWSAAGGRIETTHCREIWQQFMTEAQPVFQRLGDGTSRRETDDVKPIDALASRYEELADRGGARFGDRNKMNRAASQLLEAARAVAFSVRRLNAHQRRTAPASRAIDDLATAFRSVPDIVGRGGREKVYLGLLDELLTTAPPAHVALTALTYQDFATRPALLESVPVLVASEDGVDVDARDLADPVAASAHLMLNEYSPDGSATTTISQRLRELDRDDLLPHVKPISDREVRHASAALTTAQVELFKSIETVRRIEQRLQQVASLVAPQLGSVANEAEQIARDRPPHEAKPQLVTDWLTRVAAVGTTALDQAVETVRAQAGTLPPERREVVLAAIRGDRLADAVALLVGNPLPPPSGLRASLSRAEALGRFSAPLRALDQVRGEVGRLRDLWQRGIRGNADDDLRTTFAAVVFEALTRRNKGAVAERKGGRTVVTTQTLRQWMAQTGHNPSFVPQITAFHNIVIMTPPVSPANDAFVSRTAELGTASEPRMLVILAPQITRAVRDSFRDEVRKRNHRGVAVIDDLDLVRLLNPGGQLPDLPLVLLEIILEQQTRWSTIGPFETHEGQHTKPEMYVGRRDEADRLARTATYSRVFSGRRLGKSALLKHIRDTQSERKLPSRNVLMVIYAPIVGVDDEDQVVERICRAFADQLDYSPTLGARSADARLTELIEGFLRARGRESVLVFLDEADMFVETQIRRYESDREQCLSWVMRTTLEAHKDSMDHPRVRFVFAGYRATHLTEGAWANWGDVLRLQPLTADEAARLVAGPLARLGIDATSEAGAIAFRCGYQPAVIVRFGQQLLEYLDATITPAAREHAVVTTEHVTHVYQSPAVQQEIRTIVWNNFQGNPFGKVIFAALIVAFARLPPGAPLEDAPREVLERLREISPDFLSGGSAKGAPLDRVARELREFVGRSLLVEVSPTTQSYQLRFPHHLPVLLQEDQESIIRREVEALGTEPVDNIEVVRSLLTNTSLDEIAEAMSPLGAEFGISLAVAGAHWPASLDAGAARLTNRLGMVAEDLLDLRIDDARGLRDRHRAAINATPAVADAVAARRIANPSSAQGAVLLVGGVDLVRWAAQRRTESSDVELAVVGRIGHAQVRWWFERVRAINFAGSNPTARFLDITGGMPFLLSLLDRELGDRVGFEGDTAAEVAVAAAIAAFETGLEEHVSKLARGEPSLRLEPREIELLLMYVRAAHEFKGTDVLEVMQAWRDWTAEGFAPDLADIRPLEPGDACAMDLLLRVGLVPSDPRAARPGPFDRVAQLSAKDPLHHIAPVLQRCRST